MTKTADKKLTASQIHYFASKLSFVNYTMAVHEGDANRRLASESINIILIDSRIVPINYRKDFLKLQQVVKKTLARIHNDRTPHKLDGIRNSTAAKYIKLLWRIHDVLQYSEN